MRLKNFAFVIWIFAGLGCTKKITEFSGISFSKVKLSEPIHEAELPDSLWKKIEDMAPPPGTPSLAEEKSAEEKSAPGEKEKSAEGKEKPEKKEEAKKEEPKKEEAKKEGGKTGGILVQEPDIPREPFSFRLQLYEKTKGVLGNQNLEYQFPRGGGELDLSRVRVPKFHGTYRMRIQYDVTLGKDEKISVFFVPNSKRRDINEEIFGNGCHRYFDLTGFFQKTMNTEGIDLNTTDERDVSAVAGSYFFVMPRGNLLFMAYLTIMDSQHPDISCQRESK